MSIYSCRPKTGAIDGGPAFRENDCPWGIPAPLHHVGIVGYDPINRGLAASLLKTHISAFYISKTTKLSAEVKDHYISNDTALPASLGAVFPKLIVGFKATRKLSEATMTSLNRIGFQQYGTGDKSHISGSLTLFSDLKTILLRPTAGLLPPS